MVSAGLRPLDRRELGDLAIRQKLTFVTRLKPLRVLAGWPDMTFQEALEAVLSGRAVSRRGWHDPNLLVALSNPSQSGMQAAVTEAGAEIHSPWRLAKSDIDAEDWFVVGSVN
jgi:hypothetical protein